MSPKSRQMTDGEFVEFCYQKILGRPSDKKGRMYYIAALASRYLSREDMVVRFLTCEEFESKITASEFVPPGHFYSALPSTQEREDFISAGSLEFDEIPGLKLNADKQFALLKKFKTYHSECPFAEPQDGPLRYYLSNPSYAYTDGLTLYSMIRQFKPRRIIEIGSGYSSCAMLDTNDLFFNSNIKITFIEPYPELLQSMLKPDDDREIIIPKRVQDVDNRIFADLGENDILFIDSTHVSKLKSDVNEILFEILPELKKGVLIHFHDIFWPFEYPKEWIGEGRAWNEAYALRAFLEFNDSFEIIFFSDYLHKFQHRWFQENMPLCLKNKGGNIWIRKTGV